MTSNSSSVDCMYYTTCMYVLWLQSAGESHDMAPSAFGRSAGQRGATLSQCACSTWHAANVSNAPQSAFVSVHEVIKFLYCRLLRIPLLTGNPNQWREVPLTNRSAFVVVSEIESQLCAICCFVLK